MSERVVLVTGGSRGIGRAIVEDLVGAGHTVAFTWKSGEAAARGIEEASAGRARGFRLDLLDRERPRELVAEVEEELGPVHGLVNNAGLRRDGLLAFTSDEDWDTVIDADLGGAFRMCRAVIPGMVYRRGGSVVNVASLSAFHGVAGQTAYGAAKAGLVALTRSLAREVGRKAIRVNAVVPGYVATDLTADLTPDQIQDLTRDQALPGKITPASVASVVRFLVSEESGAVTGQALFVDAGTTA